MKTKIAQGYNPDRVTVEELGEGYRLVPRRYLDRSKYDLADVAQAWTGGEWGSGLGWANEDDSHRTLLSNAQLGMMTAARKKSSVVDVEANPVAADNVGHWRPLIEDERQILLKNAGRIDAGKFRHLGDGLYMMFSPGFGCPADHYTTTMSREEILDLKWRDITDAECKALRALHGTPRSLYNSRRFRHNATSSGGWHFGDCMFYPSDPGSDLRYQTDLTPAELETLLGPSWRPLTEDERLKLQAADKTNFDWTKFRYRGKSGPLPTAFTDDREFYTTTTLTPAELAELVKPPVVWRRLSLAEVKIMQVVAERKGTHQSDRFRCKLYGIRPHQFKRWNFGSSATDYETTHTEQEIIDLL